MISMCSSPKLNDPGKNRDRQTEKPVKTFVFETKVAAAIDFIIAFYFIIAPRLG